MTTSLRVVEDDLTDSAVRVLLAEHAVQMRFGSPEGSCHFLDLDALRRPEVTFWAARDGADLAGCGAMLELDARHGELKFMRTARHHLRRGVASMLLDHALQVASDRGYHRVSLETGSGAVFAPALALYERHGFERTAPFGAYAEDPFSVFMSRRPSGHRVALYPEAHVVLHLHLPSSDRPRRRRHRGRHGPLPTP